jgi:hypothetical protein
VCRDQSDQLLRSTAGTLPSRLRVRSHYSVVGGTRCATCYPCGTYARRWKFPSVACACACGDAAAELAAKRQCRAEVHAYSDYVCVLCLRACTYCAYTHVSCVCVCALYCLRLRVFTTRLRSAGECAGVHVPRCTSTTQSHPCGVCSSVEALKRVVCVCDSVELERPSGGRGWSLG